MIWVMDDLSSVGQEGQPTYHNLEVSISDNHEDHRPQHLNHSPLILVRHPWLCSQLVQVLLRSRSFRVKCDNNLSSFHTSSCVPQGSVLGPLLFVTYTTVLSTLISTLSLDHHLYALDTQLFFYFYPLNFDSSISHLQNALQHISSWMTANLLTLNSSKTEFLLIGSSDSKSKPTYQNTQLFTRHLPLCSKILASSLTNILLSLTKLHNYLSRACYYHIRQLRSVSGLTSIRQLLVPLLHLSWNPNLIIVIFFTLNFLSLNYPVYCRSRTLLLVLSLQLLNAVISCNITPILRSLHALAHDHWTHWIQAPFTYIQSSHNCPSSIPA